MEITDRFPQPLGHLAQTARCPHSHSRFLGVLSDGERVEYTAPGGLLSERRTGLVSERRVHPIRFGIVACTILPFSKHGVILATRRSPAKNGVCPFATSR